MDDWRASGSTSFEPWNRCLGWAPIHLDWCGTLGPGGGRGYKKKKTLQGTLPNFGTYSNLWGVGPKDSGFAKTTSNPNQPPFPHHFWPFYEGAEPLTRPPPTKGTRPEPTNPWGGGRVGAKEA